ncbi:MAG: proline--tRNA ligase, partial [Patescibacteria group bacterium]
LGQRGVQHLLMPLIHPASLWAETGRLTKVDVLAGFESRRGGAYVIAPTHEETVTDLARTYIKSYRDLPVILNQDQWKYRDEIRVSGGLLRTREFLMQDAYSFDRDEAGLEESFQIMRDAYHAIFERIGLPMMVVQADSGTIGGDASEEFMVIADAGEDTIFVCDSCDYKANVEKATSRFKKYPQEKKMNPMEAVEGKGLIGVAPLAKFLGLEVHQTTRTLLFQADKDVVAVMVRGDYNISETKLKNYLGCLNLSLATAEVVKKVTGADVGYAGPVGLPKSVKVVADLTCEDRTNFEAGANRTNYHNVNVNFDRDFPVPPFVDVRAVSEGDQCSHCKDALRKESAIELGHVFKLGTVYSEKMKAQFTDEDGKRKPLIMGCYGIGMSRVMAAAVEVSHDSKGIIWPEAIAPFVAHLIVLGKEKEVLQEAETLYEGLWEMGIDTLFDDRMDATAGEKLADADLIGIPHRIIVSARTLKEEGIEWKKRSEKESKIVPRGELQDIFVPGSVAEVEEILKNLKTGS